MTRAWLVVMVAACGRLGFDPSNGPGPSGDDEDRDGVTNDFDTCPHLAGAQTDTDGDQVGDACDPEPMTPRQSIAWFEPMGPDTPCDAVGNWTKLDGAWQLTDDRMAGVSCSWPVNNTDLWLGARITSVRGTPRQFAIDIKDFARADFYYADVYDDGFPAISIIETDGANNTVHESASLPGGIHVGSTVHHVATRTADAGQTAFDFDFGWPGELHSLSSPAPAFAGTQSFIIVIQNLDVKIEYIALIQTAL